MRRGTHLAQAGTGAGGAACAAEPKPAKAKKPLGKRARWAEACCRLPGGHGRAGGECREGSRRSGGRGRGALQEVQQEYTDWLERMGDNLASSATGAEAGGSHQHRSRQRRAKRSRRDRKRQGASWSRPPSSVLMGIVDTLRDRALRRTAALSRRPRCSTCRRASAGTEAATSCGSMRRGPARPNAGIRAAMAKPSLLSKAAGAATYGPSGAEAATGQGDPAFRGPRPFFGGF